MNTQMAINLVTFTMSLGEDSVEIDSSLTVHREDERHGLEIESTDEAAWSGSLLDIH